MIGLRIRGKDIHELKEGEYGICVDGWYAHCPGPGRLVANLTGHNVIEHEDSTITVSPSIACSDGKGGHSWHGYLERGVWRIA